MILPKIFIAVMFAASVEAFCQNGASVPALPPADRPAVPAEGEEQSTGQGQDSQPVTDDSDRMQVPSSVSTAAYSVDLGSETVRSNYISAGMAVMSTYNDNIQNGFGTRRIAADSYGFMPTLAWRQASSRVNWNLAYAPGFTLYHHYSALNQFTQNVSLDSQFRLSPHVTLSLRDSFAKTSDPFNQLTPVVSTSTSVPEPVSTVIPPVSDQITNSASAQLTYQFALNAMVGASGSFSDLHYLNPSQVQGLSDSHSKGGQAFYAYRVSRHHYVGAQYQFQSLLASQPAFPETRTETHGVNLFYTIYFHSTSSLSFYAGPQYSSSWGGGSPSFRAWSPSYGGSFNWQGQRVSLAITGGRTIGAGGGLEGAVRNESASAAVRGQLTRSWSSGLSAGYSLNSLLVPGFTGSNGHTIFGTVSVDRQFARNLGLDLGYTRLHQTYTNVSNLSFFPNTNRVWLSLAYQFIRPIGR